jgi:hypothetical protein
MIADDLALAITAAVIKDGCRVLDPFCGTARTLVASDLRGVSAVGIDVNPLALMIASAKVSRIHLRMLEDLSRRAGRPKVSSLYDFDGERTAEWFSESARRELSEIVTWINNEQIPRTVVTQLAALLSATARDVSFCRNQQWKLHRMRQAERDLFELSAWSVFKKRLKRFTEEARCSSQVVSRYKFCTGDARKLESVLRLHGEGRGFDVVVSSPPYGDSRTTVGYGGMSSICLGVVRHLDRLDVQFKTAGEIDRMCLGGHHSDKAAVDFEVSRYWRGGRDSPGRLRVRNYLADLSRSCSEIAAVASPNAQAVFVVARRNVESRRLYLDRFVTDTMRRFGFELVSLQSRPFASKKTPMTINASGRSSDVRRVVTMRQEFVVTLRR